MADKEQQDRRAQYGNELRAALTAHHDLTDKCRGCKRYQYKSCSLCTIITIADCLSVKAELIQHFAARTVTGHSTSSQALTEIINDSQKTTISPRTIRWHMSKLGLMKTKKTLPNLVEALKKTPDSAC